MKRVIGYLNCTKDIHLTINTEHEPAFIGLADVDWAGYTKTRKLTTGNILMLGNNPIQCYTNMQNAKAFSSTEAEFFSAASTGQEITRLIKLLTGFHLQHKIPIMLYKHSQSYIKMIENEKFSKHTKHLDLRYQATKQLKEDDIIELRCRPKENMIDDFIPNQCQNLN